MGIKEFIQKLTEDKEFAARYQAFESIDALIAKTNEDGYTITREELEAALQKAKSGELSDDEAEAAAGGAAFEPIIPLISNYIRKL